MTTITTYYFNDYTMVKVFGKWSAAQKKVEEKIRGAKIIRIETTKI